MSRPVGSGHQEATEAHSIRQIREHQARSSGRPMASPLQVKDGARSASEASNSPRSPPLPPNSSHIYVAAPAPAGPTSADRVTTGGVRSPNPAKRVPNNPADELRSAVELDALRKEARKKGSYSNQPAAVQRNVSAPLLATASQRSPPISPTMISTAGLSTATQPGTRSIMPRNPSIDSTVSSASATSATKLNGGGSFRTSPESAGLQDVASVIAECGSPEAAIQKLLNDKNQAASHNAQLWRLVEKQRTMILGLNKDLEKALKEKERYRKKVKEHLGLSDSTPSLTTANQQLEELVKREESPSPVVTENLAPSTMSINTSDVSTDSRKASETSDPAASGVGRSDTPLDASNAASSALPATPQSSGSANQILRDMQLIEAASVSAQDNRAIADSPIKSPRLLQDGPQVAQVVEMHRKTPSISSITSAGQPSGSFSNSKSQVSRKAPPAPLKLSSQKEAEAAARVTNNIIDPSDSEYDDPPESGSGERTARGRRKTREEDDEDREIIAQQEYEHRSRSKKDKQSKSKQSVDEAVSPDVLVYNVGDATLAESADAPTAQLATYQQPSDASVAMQQRSMANESARLPKSVTAPALLSPGLPMSPRPVDRPMNSPMPRAPNKVINSIPMSPRSGMAGLPLSPRAPRQPIPMPPQTPLSFASPHLARAEGYQTTHPPPPPPHSSLAREVRSSPSLTPEREEAPRMVETPMSPGEIYQGLVTEQYPDLLLPPNALPSIYVKTASSRMKPSRHSYSASKSIDENPVFTLAIHERSGNKQLWRVEKTFVSLAMLDEQMKSTCNFRERLPDRTLFHGHAPAKIDARRTAIDTYFHRMLECITDERSGLLFCRFLTTDAVGAERGEYFNISVDMRSDTPLSKRPRREGYLTKRGKNFGGWKARFFVLDGPVFKYFDAEGGTQLGSIKLQNAQIGKQSNNSQSLQDDEDNQFRHAFLVLEPKKKDSSSLVRHVLCAESDEERDLWVDALLQYVDYKEDLDELAPKSSLATAKSDLGPPRSPRPQRSLNDLRPSYSRENTETNPSALRAVGYDDVVAGEAPVVIGPPSPQKEGTPSPPHDGNFGPAVGPTPAHPTELPTSSHPNISAPTNLHVISNAGDWGMKPPPTPGNKDKKRSLFAGFRGRSSSDLGPGDKIASPGLPTPDHHSQGGFRAVFGAPLAEAVEFAKPADVSSELPAVVYRCIEYLLAKNALAEEGIFRLSGSNTVIKGLKDRFNNEGDVNLVADGKYYDIHAVASLLKLYLRELPSSILTRELHIEFLQCSEKHSREKVVALNTLVNKLPRPNRALLEALSSLLLSIVNNSEVNKMNVRNVGIVFAPTLNVPAPLISSFVEDQAAIFGPPLDSAGSAIHTQQVTAPAAPTDLRSPRKQMFSDLPTPAYNKTTFQSLGVLHNDDTGMVPVHPAYTSYQVAPQGEGGFGSINDALKSPTLYSTVSNGVPSSRETKAKRRESALLGVGTGQGMQKKTSMTQLREQLREEDGGNF